MNAFLSRSWLAYQENAQLSSKKDFKAASPMCRILIFGGASIITANAPKSVGGFFVVPKVVE